MTRLLRYLTLPAEITAFEARYLARMNRVAMWFFVAHLPLFVAIAAVNDTGPLTAAALTLGALFGPLLAVRSCPPRTASVVMGVTAMFMGGILVHIGQGPVQIEMHFYFFVLIALLAVFANPAVILAAAGTVAAHHVVMWLTIPASLFNYDAPWWVVAVHAAFVVVESVAACYIARSFFDNVVGLERIVSDRTAQVDCRNRDMRMLLDAVGQGFFTVDRNGVMSAERSAAVDRMLGPPAPGTTLPEFLRPYNPRAADWMAVGLDEVFADVMPLELTLGQLPSRLPVKDRTLRVEYIPLPPDGPPERLAVVLTDITAAVARERLETEHRELMAVAERIVRDRAGFVEFVQEAEQLMADLLSRAGVADLAVVKRQVHTLKGNAAIFGLETVAAACHAIEDAITDTGTLPDSSVWVGLMDTWEQVRANLKRLIGDRRSSVTLDDFEYVALLLDVLNRAPRDALARRVAAWRLEPTEKRMARIADQARQLAGRLEKGDIRVVTRGGHLRTDADHWSGFWSSFVHVVRNAVDHGLEKPAERVAAGKPPAGTIQLETRIDGACYVVSITDDGRGINWARIAAAARTRGLPADTHEDLVDALFHDGLSTAAAVTTVSGRGVGMESVRTACRILGGTVVIRSEPGRGTTFEFRFPMTAMAPDTFTLLDQHGVASPEDSFIGAWPVAASEQPGPPAGIASSTDCLTTAG